MNYDHVTRPDFLHLKQECPGSREVTDTAQGPWAPRRPQGEQPCVNWFLRAKGTGRLPASPDLSVFRSDRWCPAPVSPSRELVGKLRHFRGCFLNTVAKDQAAGSNRAGVSLMPSGPLYPGSSLLPLMGEVRGPHPRTAWARRGLKLCLWVWPAGLHDRGRGPRLQGLWLEGALEAPGELLGSHPRSGPQFFSHVFCSHLGLQPQSSFPPSL